MWNKRLLAAVLVIGQIVSALPDAWADDEIVDSGEINGSYCPAGDEPDVTNAFPLYPTCWWQRRYSQQYRRIYCQTSVQLCHQPRASSWTPQNPTAGGGDETPQDCIRKCEIALRKAMQVPVGPLEMHDIFQLGGR